MIVFRGDLRHLDYWLGHTLPVIVVLHDRESGRSYWQHVSIDTIKRTRRGWILEVPESQCLENMTPAQTEQLTLIARSKFSDAAGSQMELTNTSIESSWSVLVESGEFEAAVPHLRSLTDAGNANASVWESLAWCQYNLLTYPEALASINQALQQEPTDTQALGIRACIHAEYGIQLGDRTFIEMANAEFERQALDSQSWCDHYNFANTLRELGDLRQAESEYTRSLELNPRSPEAWVNLGTLLRSIHRHEEEIKCFERALDLDPTHGYALLNKGMYQVRHGRKPDEGAALIEQAIRENVVIASRSPMAWHWLVEAHRRNGQLTQAKNALIRGMAQHPSHHSLAAAGVRTFADLWRANHEDLPVSLGYFQRHVVLHPLDYSARSELVRALAASDKSDEAWEVLGDSFRALDLAGAADIAPAIELRRPSFSLEQCIRALAFLPQYELYRKSVPVATSLPSETYLGEISLRLKRKSEIERSLFVAAAVPFGIAFALARRLSHNDWTIEAITNVYDSIRSLVESLFIELAAYCTDDVIETKADSEHLAVILVDVMGLLSHGALLEFSRQCGWILGAIGAPETLVLDVVDEYHMSQITVGVSTGAVTVLDRELGLFPHSKETAAEERAEQTGADHKLPPIDGSKSVLVDDTELQSVLGRFADQMLADAIEATEQCLRDEIEVEAWVDTVTRKLKSVAFCAFALARGGMAQITDEDRVVIAAHLTSLFGPLWGAANTSADGVETLDDLPAFHERLAASFVAALRAHDLGVLARGGKVMKYVRDDKGKWTVSFTTS